MMIRSRHFLQPVLSVPVYVLFSVMIFTKAISAQVSSYDVFLPVIRRPPPDQLLFINDASDDVYLLNVDDRTFVILATQGPSGDHIWSPDGRKIAYLGYTYTSRALFVMNADGTGTQLLHSECCIRDLKWSPDGQHIAFDTLIDNRGGPMYGIYALDVETLTMVTYYEGATIAEHPTWSPEGAYLAFMKDMDIYRVRSDGTHMINLTDSPSNEYSPEWSPAGNLIAYMSTIPGEEADIYIMDVDGTNQTNLTNYQAWDSAPKWSPDGERILFSSTDRDGNAEIYIMNSDGSQLTNLTNSPFQEGAYLWSAAGARIAFASDRDGNSEIYVMDSDGSNARRLTDNAVWDYPEGWRPR